jgi:hypothetical protein
MFSVSFCYVTTILISGVYSVLDRTINEHGAFGGMTISRGNRRSWRKPVSVPRLTVRIPHGLIILPRIEPGPLGWEAGE